MQKSSDKFEFWPDRTTDYGVSCPFDLILFILAGNEDKKSQTSSNFDQIGPLTKELAALERLKNFP